MTTHIAPELRDTPIPDAVKLLYAVELLIFVTIINGLLIGLVAPRMSDVAFVYAAVT